jgi:predicted branched-subunit amino acid permease
VNNEQFFTVNDFAGSGEFVFWVLVILPPPFFIMSIILVDARKCVKGAHGRSPLMKF